MKILKTGLHLLFAIALGIVLILGLIYFLDTYTNHGSTTEVPNVSKKSLKEAIKTLESKGFSVEVDSTYRDSLPPLFVIKQFPAGGDKVKTGRTIQLIVNKAAAPLVEMPSLLGVRVASALQYLERNNLKLGDTIFKPDFAAGRILQQLVNGADVKPGTLLKYGTKVTLVIGSGLGNIIYNYPDFYGMTLQQAWALMDTLGLSRGAVSIDPGTKDSLNAFVYKQYPEAIDQFTHQPTLIKQGNTVDLFVSNIRKPRQIDTTAVFLDDSLLNAQRMKNNRGSLPKTSKKDTTKKVVLPTSKPDVIEPKPAPKTGEEYKK